MAENRLQQLAQMATIVASLSAIGGVVFGVVQFRETTTLQREARAVDLFVKYNELMRDEAAKTRTTTNEQAWQGNLAIAISESIFRLTRDDPAWTNTVKWIVSNHARDLSLDCATYDRAFVALVEAEVKRNVCGP